jgi:hypothetical protein
LSRESSVAVDAGRLFQEKSSSIDGITGMSGGKGEELLKSMGGGVR